MIFKTEQYNHQKTAHAMMGSRPGFALFCKMRTGKSKMLLDDAARHWSVGRINLMIIICPNGIQQNWVLKEIPKHVGIPHEAIYVHSSMTMKEKRRLNDIAANIGQEKLTIIAVNIEQLRKAKRPSDRFKFFEALVRKNNTYMVVDESHTIKTHNSQQTKGIIAIGKNADIKRIATGTPQPNGPTDIFSQFRFLNPAFLGYTTFAAFKADYCRFAEIDNKYYNPKKPGSQRKIKIIVDYKNQDKLRELIKPYVFSITLEECADIPPVISDIQYVEFTSQQNRIYKEIKEQALSTITNPPEGMEDEDLIEWMLFSGEAKVSSPNGLVSAGKMLQICGGFLKDDDGTLHELDNNLMSAVLDFIDPMVHEEKFIIWCNFIAEIEAVVAKLEETYGKHAVVSYYGATKQADRTLAIDRFNSDDNTRFFVANQAACEGIDLSESSRHAIWYNLPNYNFRVYEQACARQMGIQQKKKIIITHFITRARRDEHVLKKLDLKRQREINLVWRK